LIRKKLWPCHQKAKNNRSPFLPQHAGLIADGEEIFKEGRSRKGNGA
jgi:hypothetical protein